LSRTLLCPPAHHSHGLVHLILVVCSLHLGTAHSRLPPGLISRGNSQERGYGANHSPTATACHKSPVDMPCFPSLQPIPDSLASTNSSTGHIPKESQPWCLCPPGAVDVAPVHFHWTRSTSDTLVGNLGPNAIFPDALLKSSTGRLLRQVLRKVR
jgi:hypothetical protein